MTLAGVLALIGLALVDALNPFSIAAMAFLLSTDRPVQRGLAFVVGTFAVYLLGGVVLLEGWLVVLKTLLPTLPPWAPGSLEMLAGALAAGAGIYTWRRASSGKPPPSPSNLSLPATLVFAIVSTVSDLPTAVPYFAAASQIAAAGADGVARYAWLSLYNLIYIAPLVAMLVLRFVFGERAEPPLARVRQAVDWSFARLLPPLLLLAGIALIGDGAMRLLAIVD